MYCKGCNSYNEENSKFCSCCGAAMDEEPVTGSLVGVLQKIKFSKKTIIAAAAAVVAVILLIVIISVCSKPAYHKVVYDYYKASMDLNTKKIIDLTVPEFMLEFYEYEYDETIDDLIYELEDDLENSKDDFYNFTGVEMEDFFNEIEVEILSDKDMIPRDLDEINETFYEFYGADPDCITEGKTINVRLTLDMKDENYRGRETQTVYALKIDGKWYIDLINSSSDILFESEMLEEFSEHMGWD